jgi:phthalate 4,5-cis-dihydrodiol dehydrogenase
VVKQEPVNCGVDKRGSSSIAVALLGAGGWGSLVAGELKHVPGFELAGVFDADQARSSTVADRLTVEVYKGLDVCLSDPGVSAVIVAVPNDRHVELTAAALAAGKHVLLEKPMALTVQDAEDLARRADAEDRVLMLDHIQRYYAPLRAIKELIEAGSIGQVLAVSVRRRDLLKRTIRWLQLREHVGGLLYQSAVHEFDLLRWLCGEAVEISCTSPGRPIAPELDYPDLILSQIRFQSGAIGQLWNCMTDPMPAYDGVVTGDEGTVWFDLYDAQVRWARVGEDPEERDWSPRDRWAPWAWTSGGGIADGEAEAVRDMLADFRDSVLGRGGPAVTAWDGVRSVELAQAGYISLATTRAVDLPLSGRDRIRKAHLELESSRG